MTPGHQLCDLLQREAQALASMLNILRAEQQALKNNDTDALAHCITDKKQQINILEQIGKERDNYLASAGYGADTEGIQACIAAQDAGGKLKRLQEQFLDLADHCQKQNQINGMIADNNRRHVEKILAIMSGQDTTATSYGNRGQAIHGDISHNSIKA